MGELSWAERELEAAGYHANDPEDGPNKWLREGTLELLKVFSKQGHSGSSAPFAINLFQTLASHRPLTPLSGDDSEWVHVGDDVWQNNRDGRVFKNGKGEAYQIDGIVFWDWYVDEETGEKHKSYFTNKDSRVPVTFPYSPPEKPEYRERIETES